MTAVAPSVDGLSADLEGSGFRIDGIERLAGSPLLAASAQRI
jgi:hypothetical protein